MSKIWTFGNQTVTKCPKTGWVLFNIIRLFAILYLSCSLQIYTITTVNVWNLAGWNPDFCVYSFQTNKVYEIWTKVSSFHKSVWNLNKNFGFRTHSDKKMCLKSELFGTEQLLSVWNLHILLVCILDIYCSSNPSRICCENFKSALYIAPKLFKMFRHIPLCLQHFFRIRWSSNPIDHSNKMFITLWKGEMSWLPTTIVTHPSPGIWVKFKRDQKIKTSLFSVTLVH